MHEVNSGLTDINVNGCYVHVKINSEEQKIKARHKIRGLCLFWRNESLSNVRACFNVCIHLYIELQMTALLPRVHHSHTSIMPRVINQYAFSREGE